MWQPVSIVYTIEDEDNLVDQPGVLTIQQDSVATLFAKYPAGHPTREDWQRVGLDAAKLLVSLPWPRLRGFRFDVGVSGSLQHGLPADILRTCSRMRSLQRLTLTIMPGTDALSLQDFFHAMHDVPTLTSLTLDYIPGKDYPDIEKLRVPLFKLQSLVTRSLFPGCGILLRNSQDTLRTLVLQNTQLSHDGIQFLENTDAPLRFRNLRRLDIYQKPKNDITPLIVACPRLERLRLIHSVDIASFELFVVPALASLASPIKHLSLTGSVYLWYAHRVLFMPLLLSPESPLRNLRTFANNTFDWARIPRIAECEVFLALEARRVKQYYAGNERDVRLKFTQRFFG